MLTATPCCGFAALHRLFRGAAGNARRHRSRKSSTTHLHNWLVVWNIWIIFPYIGNNHPKWLIIFRGVGIPPIRKWWRIGRAEGDCSMLRGGAQPDARQAKVGHGIEHSSTVLGHFEGAKQQVVHFKIYMLHDRFDSMFEEAVIFAGKQIPLSPVRHGLFFQDV